MVAHSFAKHSQNICLINAHILMYWHTSCNCNLWKAFWFYSVFWVFSHIIDEYSCLKCYIFTKISQIVYLIDVQILVYQHTKCDCWLWKVFWFNCVFWGISKHYFDYSYLDCYVSKLSLIVYVINTRILIYQYVRCAWKLWNAS